MSDSAVFAAELAELGIWRPEGDGDALRESGRAWREIADLVDEITHVLDAAVARVADEHGGEAARRFVSLWSHWSGSRGYLASAGTDCNRIASVLDEFGTDVDVADRAVLRLVEDALAAAAVPSPVMLDEIWRNWLTDGTHVVATHLDHRVDDAIGRLAGVDASDVVVPEECPAVEHTSPPEVSGAADLTHLASSAIDFGAGPGTVLSELPPIDGTWARPIVRNPTTAWTSPCPSPPPPPTSICPPTTFASPWQPDPWMSQPWAPQPWVSEPWVPEEPPRVDPLPPDPPAAWEPEPWEPSEPWEPEPWEPPPFEPAPIAPWRPPSSDALDPVVTPAPRVPPFEPVEPAGVVTNLGEADSRREPIAEPVTPPVAIAIEPPGGSPAAGAAIGAAAGAAGVAGRGRLPFFPMMPMGGMAGGGDEASEPTRRVRRRRRTG